VSGWWAGVPEELSSGVEGVVGGQVVPEELPGGVERVVGGQVVLAVPAAGGGVAGAQGLQARHFHVVRLLHSEFL
jgi:hypothetical protein